MLHSIKTMINRAIQFFVFLLLIIYPTGVLFRFKIAPNILIVPQDIIVFCIFLSVLIYYVRKRTLPSYKGFFLGQACFFGVGLLSLAINFFIHRDINVLVSLLYELRYIAYLSLIFVPNLFDEKSFINKLFLFSGATVLILGFLQFILFASLKPLFYLGWDEHLYRLFSTFLDPNFAGVFFVVFLFYLLGNVFGKDKFKSYRNIIFSFFTIIAIYLTFSRTAIIALVSGTFFITVARKRFKELVIVLVILVVSVFAFADTHIEGLNPFRTVSTGERMKSAVNTYKIIEKNMLIGVGFNSFRDTQIRYGFRSIEGSSLSNSDSGTDNSYLFVLATTGVLGFIPYMLSYYFLGKKLFREGRVGSFFLTGALISVMVASLFLNSLFYTPILAWLFLNIALRKNL